MRVFPTRPSMCRFLRVIRPDSYLSATFPPPRPSPPAPAPLPLANSLKRVRVPVGAWTLGRCRAPPDAICVVRCPRCCRTRCSPRFGNLSARFESSRTPTLPSRSCRTRNVRPRRGLRCRGVLYEKVISCMTHALKSGPHTRVDTSDTSAMLAAVPGRDGPPDGSPPRQRAPARVPSTPGQQMAFKRTRDQAALCSWWIQTGTERLPTARAFDPGNPTTPRPSAY